LLITLLISWKWIYSIMNTICDCIVIWRMTLRCDKWILRSDGYYILTSFKRWIIVSWQFLLTIRLLNRHLSSSIWTLKSLLKASLINSKTFSEIILSLNTLMLKKRCFTFFAIKWIFWPWPTMFDFFYPFDDIIIIIIDLSRTTLPG